MCGNSVAYTFTALHYFGLLEVPENHFSGWDEKHVLIVTKLLSEDNIFGLQDAQSCCVVAF